MNCNSLKKLLQYLLKKNEDSVISITILSTDTVRDYFNIYCK